MTQAAGQPVKDVMSSVEIGGLEAVWVLGAHLYAVLTPLVLVLVTSHHWEYLVATVYNPSLFYVAALLLAAGSAFEVAQNTIDRWFLTPEVASASGAGLCDMLAFWFVTVGQSVVAIGLAGDLWWVLAIAGSVVVLFPILYLKQIAHFGPPAMIGVVVALLAFDAFGDPIIFVSVFLGGVTMFFFNALMDTGAQLLHGCTTVVASSGIWFFRWAVENGDAGTRESWWMLALVIAGAVIVMAILKPVMSKLPASERIVRQGT
jgi:hypothetical protein